MSLLQRTLVRTLVGAIALPTVIVVGSLVLAIGIFTTVENALDGEWS